MASTPSSPVMQGLKNFWQRPEGTVGKIVLVLGGVAVAYGFVQILPFLIAAATDTLHLAALIGAILVFLFIVTDKRVRTLAKLMFQSVMRYLTGLFIELDPIGILKNYVGEMKKNLAIMDEQLGNLNGSTRTKKMPSTAWRWPTRPIRRWPLAGCPPSISSSTCLPRSPTSATQPA